MEQHITALFRDLDTAMGAVDALVGAGVARKDISLVTSEPGASNFGFKAATKAPEMTVAGGAIGGALGAVIVCLVAATAGGVGVWETGPILLALIGLGTGGAIGGLVGALMGLRIPEHEAKFYKHSMTDRNAILVGVTTRRLRKLDAKAILRQFHPTDLTEHL
jgi:hypothetical protein